MLESKKDTFKYIVNLLKFTALKASLYIMKCGFCFQPQGGNISGSPHLPVRTGKQITSKKQPFQTQDNRQCRTMLLQWKGTNQESPTHWLAAWRPFPHCRCQGENQDTTGKCWTENTRWTWRGPGSCNLWDRVLKRRKLQRKFQNRLGIC